MKQGIVNDIVNNKEEQPLAHYIAIYEKLDANEVSKRCNIVFEDGEFSIKLLNNVYCISHPVYKARTREAGARELTNMENILLLRYLCEGHYSQFGGKSLAYQEVPWGTVYLRNFNGRCILRAAKVFGSNANRIKAFVDVMENEKQLRAVNIKAQGASSTAAYKFEFLNDMYMSIILYEADDEFPSSAQILFDDNLAATFSAEDLAVVGEIAIARIGALMENRK